MPWRLWRQDDNGNRFMVGEFVLRAEADTRLAELTRHPHRQIYWLEEVPPAAATAPSKFTGTS